MRMLFARPAKSGDWTMASCDDGVRPLRNVVTDCGFSPLGSDDSQFLASGGMVDAVQELPGFGILRWHIAVRYVDAGLPDRT